MKKILSLILTLFCVLSLVGCGRSMDDIIKNESSITAEPRRPPPPPAQAGAPRASLPHPNPYTHLHGKSYSIIPENGRFVNTRCAALSLGKQAFCLLLTGGRDILNISGSDAAKNGWKKGSRRHEYCISESDTRAAARGIHSGQSAVRRAEGEGAEAQHGKRQARGREY